MGEEEALVWWRGTFKDYGTALEGDEEALNNINGQWWGF